MHLAFAKYYLEEEVYQSPDSQLIGVFSIIPTLHDFDDSANIAGPFQFSSPWNVPGTRHNDLVINHKLENCLVVLRLCESTQR